MGICIILQIRGLLHMKKIVILTMATIILLTGCSNINKNTYEYIEENGVKYNAKIEKNSFQVFQNNEWKTINIKAINLLDVVPNSKSLGENIDEKLILDG